MKTLGSLCRLLVALTWLKAALSGRLVKSTNSVGNKKIVGFASIFVQ